MDEGKSLLAEEGMYQGKAVAKGEAIAVSRGVQTQHCVVLAADYV
jgi:hypothetical protein